ncbi:flagellin, partial [Alphaproteobacteria bacterium]|nr:flagellin [Alphaproteobacteria bacterium]
MNSIHTNVSALNAQKNMQIQNDSLSEAMERLSSGLRINSAADDAAGSAIASKMEAQVRSLDVAIRNSYDAISMTQTAEGALGEMENILQRIRELGVQASNSTLSASDRKMIQSEVDALVKEVDNIASTTHFNNVSLLNGDNADVTFQIGINSNSGLKVNLQKSDATSLGLKGATGVTTLTSERVAKTDFSVSGADIAAADVKINGFNAFSTAFAEDLNDATDNTAKGYADALNLNTGTHGAEANAFNTLTSDAMGTFNMTNTFTINGETVALASSYSELTDKINEAVSGVEAKLNSDNTITLSNTTGDDILVASNSASVGFAAGTYTGFVELSNLDGSQVTIEAGSATNGYTNGTGTMADVNSLGFNEFSTVGVLEGNTVSGTALTANEMKINDVFIGESLSGSATHIAAAINEKTSDHGVTADANNAVTLTFDFEAQPSSNGAFKLNGQAVDLTTATSAASVVTAINNATIGDLRAEASPTTGSVKVSSTSGVDIVVSNSDNDFLTAATDIHGTSITTGFGNGAFDLDGLIDGSTTTATGILDTSGSAFIGEVVNSRVVMTSTAVADMNDNNAVIKVTGEDSTGATITESLTAANFAAAGEQVVGSTIFHKVTQVEIATGALTNATAGFDIGLIGATTAATAQGLDLDSLGTITQAMSTTALFSDIALTSAGGAKVSTTFVAGSTANTSDDLHGAVVVLNSSVSHTGSSTVFTITGTDADGAVITEDITYALAGGAVHGTTAFHTVTKVASDKQVAGDVTIGTYQVGDRIEAKGNLQLSNSTQTPIKIEAVGDDITTALASGGTIDVILDKVGVRNQSQSFEVSGTSVSMETLASANASLALIDKAIDQVSLFRSSFGAVENRIDASINNLTTLKVNTEAAKSRIEDADFAKETSQMTKSQILSQAAT